MAQITVEQAIATVRTTAWQDQSAGLESGTSPESFGSYTGLPPTIRLLQDGRNAELVDPIAYHGADNVDWPVTANSKLDGASIPQAFWSLIGGPFEGQYRDASIVHDYYCDHHVRRWRDTARMFYAAMRCSGVGATKAKIMFYAVYRFGPKWPDPGLESASEFVTVQLTDSEAPSLVADTNAIAEHGLELEQIEALVDARMR